MFFRNFIILLVLFVPGCKPDSVSESAIETWFKQAQSVESVNKNTDSPAIEESACYNDSNRLVTINGVNYNLTVFARLEPVNHAFVIISKPEIQIFPKVAPREYGTLNGRAEYNSQDHPEFFGRDGRWHGVTCEYQKNGATLGEFSPENRFLYLISEDGIDYQIDFTDAGLDEDLIFGWPTDWNDKDYIRKAESEIKNSEKFNDQIKKFLERPAVQQQVEGL